MMTYGEFKETEMYLNAEDSAICVNDEDILYDEMYYPEELDHLPVIGFCSTSEGMLQINLLCSNWEGRNEVDWAAEA
ncbi:MAG TPA: hypothetical protein DCW90_21845 [Lachnospiraceae bacterium]|nr:hypothetical protein [Lachnospiraceae bacterium]